MTTAPTACVLNKESCWRSNPISPGLLFWVFYTLEEPSSQHSEDYAVLFYIWLLNFCTWILLDLPKKYKALLISFVYFFLLYLSLFVICLFSMLIYSPTKIIDYFSK